MRKVIVLLLLMFGMFLEACQTNNKNQEFILDRKETDEISEVDQRTESKSDTLNPLILKDQGEVKKQPKSKPNKIEQEIDELLESTKRIILSNKTIPSFIVDTFENRIEKIKKAYLNLSCESGENENLKEFSIEFYKDYKNSSVNTKLFDGHSFCLKQIVLNDTDLGKIIYGRNEGGHTSDQITLVTADQEGKLIYSLPLSYHTGSDGHEITVRSSMNNNLITREIEERYGWSHLHPDSLSQQPRRIISQQILIDHQGKMELINQQVTKYNIDELFSH